MIINDWNKLPTYCLNTSSVNMYKNENLQISQKGGLHINEKLLDSG